jgi:hypothetical protein
VETNKIFATSSLCDDDDDDDVDDCLLVTLSGEAIAVWS